MLSDSPGEVEHCDTKKYSRRRYVVLNVLQTSWYGERKDEGVTDDLMICEPLSELEGRRLTEAFPMQLAAVRIQPSDRGLISEI